MRIDFIKRESDSTRLILLFAGWSADARIAQDVDMPGWDVAVVSDYSDFKLDIKFLEEYYTVYLFAWSLGVYAASVALPADKITAAFAINGTLSPIDDDMGIPIEIFQGTADNLSPRNLLKFRMRMMFDREEWNNNAHLFDTNTDETRINHLQRQLYNFINHSKKKTSVNKIEWTRAYISDSDRIFPPDNMRNAWNRQENVEIISLNGGHFVSLSTIVSNVIPDSLKLTERFTKASDTYDTQAIAQYSIAIRLSKMLETLKPERESHILEIGCGTGLFTREYAHRLNPSKATFVDITKCGPFGIADEEEYVVDDAERWIAETDKKWDIILSASCIQWFANIPMFLQNCRNRLNERGILAISTFLPGNLFELDATRPSPLIYPDKNMLQKILSELFTEVIIESEDIVVEFQSHREMLMHLKHTGVAGSSQMKLNISKGQSKTPTRLTYRPVYFICRL